MPRATLSPFLILVQSLRNLSRLGSTLACGLALLLAACGSSAGPTTPTPTPGRPGPAMVQIENSILARPLAGLQQANIVYEYLAEGGITRMTAIYFSPTGSQRIEPVRSARPVTIRLWHSYHGVLFFSGANIKVLQVIQDQQIPALTEVNGAPAVDFDLQGTGPADVFTRGHRYKATWDLTNPELPLKIVGADGKVMRLPSGLTWFHLVDPGTAITAS